VTFVNFLDFVVKSQGDGPDPYGEIKQVGTKSEKNTDKYKYHKLTHSYVRYKL
jgi:hypothetical protein